MPNVYNETAEQLTRIYDELSARYWKRHERLLSSTYNAEATQRRDMINLGDLAQAMDYLSKARSILRGLNFTDLPENT